MGCRTTHEQHLYGVIGHLQCGDLELYIYMYSYLCVLVTTGAHKSLKKW